MVWFVFQGESIYTGPEIGFTELLFSTDHKDITIAKGKVAMYFEADGKVPMPDIVQENGAVGVIYVRNMNDLLECPVNFPCIYMDFDTASDIYFYMETTTRLSSHQK